MITCVLEIEHAETPLYVLSQTPWDTLIATGQVPPVDEAALAAALDVLQEQILEGVIPDDDGR